MKFAHIRVSEYFTFAEQIFHSVAISLARRANFVEKSTHCLGRQMCAFFWCGKRELNPYGKTTRPSNVRVCQFRHSRRTLSIIQQKLMFVKGFFEDFCNFFKKLSVFIFQRCYGEIFLEITVKATQ